MKSTKTTVWAFLPGILTLSLLLCSCHKADEAPTAADTGPTVSTGPIVATRVVGSTGSATEEKMKTCFQCNGTGKMKCPDCRDGLVDCPSKCLKLTQGTWIHMDAAGHPPTDVWQKFPRADGSARAFNQSHVGHVIVLINGDWVDTGPCPVCHGTGKIECSKCQGTGEIACTICDGRKVVPESWTVFDNPKLKNRPDHVTLKDGRVLFGKKVFVFGDHTTFQTTNGNVEVETSDIIAEAKSDVK